MDDVIIISFRMGVFMMTIIPSSGEDIPQDVGVASDSSENLKDLFRQYYRHSDVCSQFKYSAVILL